MPPRHAEIWIAFGQQPPGTTAHRLFGERLVPVARRELAQTIDTVDNMLEGTIISVRGHQRNWAQIFGRDYLPPYTRVIEVDTTLAALTLASAGSGFALARSPASDDLVRRLELVPCVPGLSLGGVEDYLLLHPASTPLRREALAFRDWVLAEAGKVRI